MDAVMQQRGRQQVLMNEGQRLILHSVALQLSAVAK